MELTPHARRESTKTRMKFDPHPLPLFPDLGSAEGIASRLNQDQQLCRDKKRPSSLALQLSKTPPGFLNEVSWHLTPQKELSKEIRMGRCKSIIEGIKDYLDQLDNPSADEAEAIAVRLRQDQQLCRQKKVPSTLACRLPNAKSSLFDAVAWNLTPHVDVPKALRSKRCESIIEGIKAYIGQLDSIEGDADEDALVNGTAHIPKNEEFEAALKVLEYLQANDSVSQITPSSSLTEVLAAVRAQISVDNNTRVEYVKQARKAKGEEQKTKTRRCYMCRQTCTILNVHDLYPSLCRPCGAFNLGSSQLSQPGKLDLTGRTALVTGGRINLGYHTALRLLRCGANVIVSSRYPADAADRYSKETDFTQWESRLKVAGADFRTAQDAFRLVHVVKELLRSWNGETGPTERGNLDILINNAAQTLTDPVKIELVAISREDQLRELASTKTLLAGCVGNAYQPRIRGGVQESWVSRIENKAEQLRIDNENKTEESAVTHQGLPITGYQDPNKSSWVQSLQEIPYEDLINAHSVNAFVPLILCRELLPCMGAYDARSITKPLGYIVNVSSREGILEDTPNSRSKSGHHVHTNMSKAAINMITETEAMPAWRNRRVAMNSVDPGYMSAAPEWQRDEGCPIGFEDGAARILWPIVVGEREGRVIAGRFLKHFEQGAAVIRR
jgi:NAD(P)-dependent dehydrogenase (short-subunit alcohol dehydrogenase family)